MIKHTQHIVAFDKQRFGELKDGINLMSEGEFFRRAEASIFIDRRHELETNENAGQLLPYLSLYQVAPDGRTHVFAYQRGKGVGEQRLAGNYSIGIGGHVDLIDVAHTNSTIDIARMLTRAIHRECDEEIEWKGADAHTLATIKYIYGSSPHFIGIINDQSDSVGRVHYGALYSLQIPWNLTPVCKEEELVTVGVVPTSELAGKPVENWSRMVLQLIDEMRDPE